MPVARASGKERSQVTGALIATFIHLPKIGLCLALTYPFSQPTVTISRHSFHKPTLMIKIRSCLSSASPDQSVRKGYAIGFALPAYWCITTDDCYCKDCYDFMEDYHRNAVTDPPRNKGKKLPLLQSKMLLPLTKTQNFLAMIQKWILPGSWRPVMHVDDVTRLGLLGVERVGVDSSGTPPLLSILFPNAVFNPFWLSPSSKQGNE
ncbi:hypothetical protein TNIN_307981 [Trichonephila inaurata madagascariensis]|uniref:Uncharacterized protein n=1 Tax=Trichonephila inaurata madagascariensis TaxID=2747483 RepID=A0A8X7C713_9ARAC|nr:hypothetical protein TNIN_307981 [Trichonephila inaurata madagascariensis]